MSDSPRPTASAASLEIPDLKLEPAPRASGKAMPRAAATPERPVQGPQGYGYSTPHLFDEDAFAGQSLSLDLDEGPQKDGLVFGGLSQFEGPGAFELEPVELADLVAAVGRTQVRESESESERRDGLPGAAAAWPSGRALDPARIKVDPLELATLAGYGESPEAIQLSPAYAFRVFARQRTLKRELLRISAESERAECEREAALGELSRAVRPSAEKLAAAGSVEVPDHWLGRVRALSERADQLALRRELLRSAIDAYDRVRVRQGIRLTCTLIGVMLLLIGLKLAI
jgi:hypothetical protein